MTIGGTIIGERVEDAVDAKNSIVLATPSVHSSYLQRCDCVQMLKTYLAVVDRGYEFGSPGIATAARQNPLGH